MKTKLTRKDFAITKKDSGLILRFAAMDANGTWYLYEYRPSLCVTAWMAEGLYSKAILSGRKFSGNWRESLVEFED